MNTLRVDYEINFLPDDMMLTEFHPIAREFVIGRIKDMQRYRAEDKRERRSPVTDKVIKGFVNSAFWFWTLQTKRLKRNARVQGAAQFDWDEPFDDKHLIVTISVKP